MHTTVTAAHTAAHTAAIGSSYNTDAMPRNVFRHKK